MPRGLEPGWTLATAPRILAKALQVRCFWPESPKGKAMDLESRDPWDHWVLLLISGVNSGKVLNLSLSLICKMQVEW